MWLHNAPAHFRVVHGLRHHRGAWKLRAGRSPSGNHPWHSARRFAASKQSWESRCFVAPPGASCPDAGEKLLARLAPTLRALDAAVAETTANRGTASPQDGSVSAHRGWFGDCDRSRLGSFLSSYPDVVLELVTDDSGGHRRRALRRGHPPRRAGRARHGRRPDRRTPRLLVVGTPRYLARHGRPSSRRTRWRTGARVHFRPAASPIVGIGKRGRER